MLQLDTFCLEKLSNNMEILRDNQEQLMCPYNPSHYIRKSRMDMHLVKCRKSYQSSDKLAICDFNSTHRIPEPELPYHHHYCPSRKVIELDICVEESSVIRQPKPIVHEASAVPVDSSWDDVNIPTYNPKAYCESRPIIRRLDTESAATKRNFRLAERQRFSKLQPSEPTELSSATSGNSAPNRKHQPVNLPPTPEFIVESIEPTPDQIKKLLGEVSILPKEASIPE
ncbi:gametocyte-specific factor 1 homolog isoform X2 [Euwallacea fornicatus]|uniref:gametocyte-specific factor 1 homolog isoform X2 n=1 Tax=Euwallacea fornicatus TaxID=995702 RepID=UPI00338F0A91